MFDISNADKLFEDYVAPGLEVEIASESKLWDRLGRTTKGLTLGGKAAKQKVLIRPSQAARASNNSSYPTAQESTPEETIVYLKRALMFALKFDGFALEAAAKGGTVEDPILFEKTGINITIKNVVARQLMMDGSGRLCQANGAGSSSQTLTVDSPYFKNEPTKFLEVGRVIDAYDPSDDSHDIDSIAITAVDKANKQVTLASAQNWADDCWIYDEDVFNKTEAAGKGEMMGLLGIAYDDNPPTGALQGLDVSTYPEWKAFRYHNSGTPRDLSEELILQALDDVSDFAIPTFMLSTKAVRRKLFTLLKDYREYTEKGVMWGGWAGFPFYYDGRIIPIVVDNYVPDGMIIGGDEKKLTIYSLTSSGIVWEKGISGQGILKQVAGKNEYTAEGHIFANMGVSLRRGFFRIEDIKES